MLYLALIVPAVQIHLMVLLLVTRNINIYLRLLMFLLSFVLLINNSFFAIAYDMKLQLIHNTYNLSFWQQCFSNTLYFVLFILALVLTAFLLVAKGRSPVRFCYLSLLLIFSTTIVAMAGMYYNLQQYRAANEGLSEEAAVKLIYGVFTYLFLTSVVYIVIQSVTVIQHLRKTEK